MSSALRMFRSRIWSNPISPGVGHALVQRGEFTTVVEVGDGHRVTGRPQLVGERAHTFGQALSVVEQQNVGHRTPSIEIERSRLPYAPWLARRPHPYDRLGGKPSSTRQPRVRHAPCRIDCIRARSRNPATGLLRCASLP